jgi:hypothetical protein
LQVIAMSQPASAAVLEAGRTIPRWWPCALFALCMAAMAFVAHAAAYLTHEYAHSVMAWWLGWMSRPFGIDYGTVSLGNVVLLQDVSDNVDYAPIFSGGHGGAAAAVALAGPFIGNGAMYGVAVLAARLPVVRRCRGLLGLCFAYALMCAGNVWSYVPLRAIATHADIALAARGLGVSVWGLLPWLLVPSLFVMWHFFRRLYPAVQAQLTGGSPLCAAMLAAYVAFWYFCFFSGDGIGGDYGPVSQALCIVSRYVGFPLAMLDLMRRYALSENAGPVQG